MSTFDRREKGFESKYVHDQEITFKATARRNKLLGLWAAEKLGLAGEAADTYAMEVVKSDFDEPGDEDVFRKVFGDLEKRGVSEHQVRREMSTLLETARQQIVSKTSE